MQLHEYLLVALVGASGLAAAGGGVMIAKAPVNYRAIKGCFWVAAICFGLIGIVWGTTADHYSMVLRLIAAGVTAAIAAMALVWMLSQLAEKPEKLTANIFAECNAGMMPKTVPPDGRIYHITIQRGSAEHAFGGLGYFFGAPGSPASNFGPLQIVHECKVTNYGSLPVFAVKLSLHLVFFEAIIPVNQPNARQSGAMKAANEWPIVIPKIDAGRENPFIFYITSFSPDFIEVTLPKEITLRIGTDQIEQVVPLNQSSDTTIHVTPYIERK